MSMSQFFKTFFFLFECLEEHLIFLGLYNFYDAIKKQCDSIYNIAKKLK